MWYVHNIFQKNLTLFTSRYIVESIDWNNREYWLGMGSAASSIAKNKKDLPCYLFSVFFTEIYIDN